MEAAARILQLVRRSWGGGDGESLFLKLFYFHPMFPGMEAFRVAGVYGPVVSVTWTLCDTPWSICIWRFKSMLINRGVFLSHYYWVDRAVNSARSFYLRRTRASEPLTSALRDGFLAEQGFGQQVFWMGDERCTVRRGRSIVHLMC